MLNKGKRPQRPLFWLAAALCLLVGVCNQAVAQTPGLVIEGEREQPQLSEIPLPTFPYEWNDDLPQFDPTAEMLDLLQQPEILADLPVGGLDEEANR